MPDNLSTVKSLVGGLEFSNPRLKSLLEILADDLYGLNRQINPPVAVSSNLAPGGDVVSVATPLNFLATVFENDIRLSWQAPGTDTFLYEIRLGPVYATASILLTTATLSADIDPISRFILTGASYTFWIATVDNLGNRSTPAQVVVAIPNIGAPVVTITVVGNNVLLKWTRPSSTFTIDHYDVFKNSVLIGRISGTFDVVFESVGGIFNYNIQAVDIVGNVGTPSNTVTATLSNPSDFTLFSTVFSTLSGAKVNAIIDTNGTLFAPLSTTETYQQHFVNNGFATWQDAITAGFPLYFEPGPNVAATYTEIFDFGSIVNNVIVALDYNTSRQNGTVSITSTIEISTDGISYDTPVSGNTRFATSLRYARVIFTFTPADNKSSINFFNLKASINVHLETDEGSISAVATDTPGTHITFTKAFKSMKSLVLIPNSSTSVFPTYINLTTTGADLLAFDNAGVRITRILTWIARGII